VKINGSWSYQGRRFRDAWRCRCTTWGVPISILGERRYWKAWRRKLAIIGEDQQNHVVQNGNASCAIVLHLINPRTSLMLTSPLILLLGSSSIIRIPRQHPGYPLADRQTSLGRTPLWVKENPKVGGPVLVRPKRETTGCPKLETLNSQFHVTCIQLLLVFDRAFGQRPRRLLNADTSTLEIQFPQARPADEKLWASDLSPTIRGMTVSKP